MKREGTPHEERPSRHKDNRSGSAKTPPSGGRSEHRSPHTPGKLSGEDYLRDGHKSRDKGRHSTSDRYSRKTWPASEMAEWEAWTEADRQSWTDSHDRRWEEEPRRPVENSSTGTGRDRGRGTTKPTREPDKDFGTHRPYAPDKERDRDKPRERHKPREKENSNEPSRRHREKEKDPTGQQWDEVLREKYAQIWKDFVSEEGQPKDHRPTAKDPKSEEERRDRERLRQHFRQLEAEEQAARHSAAVPEVPRLERELFAKERDLEQRDQPPRRSRHHKSEGRSHATDQTLKAGALNGSATTKDVTPSKSVPSRNGSFEDRSAAHREDDRNSGGTGGHQSTAEVSHDADNGVLEQTLRDHLKSLKKSRTSPVRSSDASKTLPTSFERETLQWEKKSSGHLLTPNERQSGKADLAESGQNGIGAIEIDSNSSQSSDDDSDRQSEDRALQAYISIASKKGPEPTPPAISIPLVPFPSSAAARKSPPRDTTAASPLSEGTPLSDSSSDSDVDLDASTSDDSNSEVMKDDLWTSEGVMDVGEGTGDQVLSLQQVDIVAANGKALCTPVNSVASEDAPGPPVKKPRTSVDEQPMMVDPMPTAVVNEETSEAKRGNSDDDDIDDDDDNDEPPSPLRAEILQAPFADSLELGPPEMPFQRFQATVCELCGMEDHTTADCTNCICRSCLQYGHWDCGTYVPRLCKHCLKDTHRSQDCIQERFCLTRAMADLPTSIWSELPCTLSTVQPVSLAGWDPDNDPLLAPTSPLSAQLSLESMDTMLLDDSASARGQASFMETDPIHSQCSTSHGPLNTPLPPRGPSLTPSTPIAATDTEAPVSHVQGADVSAVQQNGCDMSSAGHQPTSQQLQIRCFLCGNEGHFDCSRPPTRNFAYCCVCSLTDHHYAQCPFLSLRPVLHAT